MGVSSAILDTASDLRSGELLDAARSVFAAKGFEKASMQDLAQAAGMSAGNFYRYFPSKDAIIEAMVQRDLDAIEEKFEELLQADDPLPLLRARLMRELDFDDCDGAAIWSEILAAANRRSEVASLFERLELRIISNVVSVFARTAGIDRATAEARFSAHATLLFMMILGIKMRLRSDDGFDGAALRALVLRTLDFVLSDVAGAAPDPAPGE